MKSKCRCGYVVSGTFKSGWYYFNHCGRSWKKEAAVHGKNKESNDGTKVGAAVGALGAIASAMNPLGGLFVGALVGSAFNSSDKRKCPHCRDGTAFPTGRSGKSGDKQYQCSNRDCKRFSYNHP